jgi:hypothetical protein
MLRPEVPLPLMDLMASLMGATSRQRVTKGSLQEA